MDRAVICRHTVARAVLLGAALLLLALPPGATAAERGIALGFSDQARFINNDSEQRAIAFETAAEIGSSYARIGARWSKIETSDPADPRNPADPAYFFNRLDNAVRDADARDLEVLLTIHSAPKWAEGPDNPGIEAFAPDGTWDPDPDRIRDFAYALARRYDGSFRPAPGAVALPRVALYEAWNEPNLTGFLSPQWTESNAANGPRMYRGLLNGTYEGVKSAQPGAQVIAGSTGPNGGKPGSRRVSPLRFFRDLFCLGGGRNPEPTPCPEPAKFDLVSHHPISPERSPRKRAVKGDAAIREMPKIRMLLRTAEREGTVLPAGLKRGLWATEFWWESDPPTESTYYDVPTERSQARNIADAIRLLWRFKVDVGLLFQIRDSETVSASPRLGWGAGVLFSDGSRKMSYKATRFPFVADRISRKRISVWTRSPAAGRLKVVVGRKRGAAKTLHRERVAAGEVVVERIMMRRGSKLWAKVDGERSFRWGVPRKRITRG